MHELLGGAELIRSGGFMMIPLLITATIAVAIILERGRVFLSLIKTGQRPTSQMLSALVAGQGQAQKSHPVQAVIFIGYKNFSNSTEMMELAMKTTAERWLFVLEKRIAVLDTVITAAPLMGLLGTITGMMGSFRILSEKGVNEPNAITGGVAEALIATATGLIIALICLFAYNYFSNCIQKLATEMELAAQEVLEFRLNQKAQP